jgi:hypothetical protein
MPSFPPSFTFSPLQGTSMYVFQTLIGCSFAFPLTVLPSLFAVATVEQYSRRTRFFDVFWLLGASVWTGIAFGSSTQYWHTSGAVIALGVLAVLLGLGTVGFQVWARCIYARFGSRRGARVVTRRWLSDRHRDGGRRVAACAPRAPEADGVAENARGAGGIRCALGVCHGAVWGVSYIRRRRHRLSGCCWRSSSWLSIWRLQLSVGTSCMMCSLTPRPGWRCSVRLYMTCISLSSGATG